MFNKLLLILYALALSSMCLTKSVQTQNNNFDDFEKHHEKTENNDEFHIMLNYYCNPQKGEYCGNNAICVNSKCQCEMGYEKLNQVDCYKPECFQNNDCLKLYPTHESFCKNTYCYCPSEEDNPQRCNKVEVIDTPNKISPVTPWKEEDRQNGKKGPKVNSSATTNYSLSLFIFLFMIFFHNRFHLLSNF